jgi:outer membrane protein TolC
VAKRNRDISEVDFKETVLNTTANVKQLYYELIYAADNLVAQRQSLSLATKLVEENRIKVRVGTMAPLDVVAAEAEQASREESVIVAENALWQAEDALKQAIFPKNDPAVWNLHVVPTERPSAERVAVDIEAATKIALERRTDLVASRLSLENAEYGVKFTKNQKLPQLRRSAGAAHRHRSRRLQRRAGRRVRPRLPHLASGLQHLLPDPEPPERGRRRARGTGA